MIGGRGELLLIFGGARLPNGVPIRPEHLLSFYRVRSMHRKTCRAVVARWITARHGFRYIDTV
jgi:hypothetical protein